MLYSGAKGTMTPNNRLQRTALPRRRYDTSAFAVQTIRRWWFSMGIERYPKVKQLVITPDGGGSNGHRVRLWKLELSRLAQETGLDIEVHHFPPGTSKWNNIELNVTSFTATGIIAFALVNLFRLFVNNP